MTQEDPILDDRLDQHEDPTGPSLSRRRLFGLAGAGTAGLIAAGAVGGVVGRASAENRTDAPPVTVAGSDSVPFHGAHQAGIDTPAQDHLHFAALDVLTDDRDELSALLRAWTDAARRLTAGQDAGPIGAVDGDAYAPPDDTGEALGLPASGLTLTVGFGPGLFDRSGKGDRFGLAAHRPSPLADLPPFPHDQIDPARSGGDLCIQACANDPQVAVHAVRNLARIGAGLVGVRYQQLGFGRTSSTTTTQATPRNLFGFKDGTANVKAEDSTALDRYVWVARDDPGGGWMAGGSYLVTRRVRMFIETWDTSTLREQERVIGRTKGTGAPLGQRDEFDEIDFTRQTPDGPAIPSNSHVFLAHPDNVGTAILRRGYSFVDGTDELGRLDAGLFFMCYQRDPDTGFVRVQRNLRRDAMNEYTRHTSSAVFACPPGVRDASDWWGRTLFEA